MPPKVIFGTNLDSYTKPETEELLDFQERIHKRKDKCWELYTKAGNPYLRDTVPLWIWGRGLYHIRQIVTHAAARLLGVSSGPLEEPLRKYDEIRGEDSCIKYCINPAHLHVVRRGSRDHFPKLEPSPQEKPPKVEILDNAVVKRSGLYVQNRQVRPMLDENKERQNRPKVARPGFAGKHEYHIEPEPEREDEQ